MACCRNCKFFQLLVRPDGKCLRLDGLTFEGVPACALFEERDYVKHELFERPEKDITHHYLKTLPEYFNAVGTGIKTFEVRFNDRNYKVSDILHLQEFCHGEYTGREVTAEICYILDNPQYCKEGFVVLGIKRGGVQYE